MNTFMANYLDHWVGGERMPRYAHNCYLQVAAETGVVGLATFGWFLIVLMGAGWRAQRSPALGTEDRYLLLAWLAATTAFLTQAFFDTPFYSLRFAALFTCVSGLIMGYAATPARLQR